MEAGGAAAVGTPTLLQQAQPAPSQPVYMQLALYLAGNALSVFVGLLLWNLNTVLADFRDSMLYALLCSIALRPVKDWCVHHMDASLADPQRSMASALLSLAVLPLTALKDAWEEAHAILLKWRQVVQEELQRRQAMLVRRSGGEGGATPPTSPHTPRAAPAAAGPGAGTHTGVHTLARRSTALHTLPSLALYGHAAVKVLKSRRTSKKRRKQRQMQKRPPEGSSVLFRWLFRGCAAWLAWEYVRDSWSTTVQLVLLLLTSLLALGLIPLLLITTNRYLATAVFSPAKTPGASALTPPTTEVLKRRSSLHAVSPLKRPIFSPCAQLRRRRGVAPAPQPGSPLPSAAAVAGEPRRAWWQQWRSRWTGMRVAYSSLAAAASAGLRSALRRHLHALVALLLVLGLFAGTTGLAAFLSMRVAQEGRDTVLAVADMFPTAWAGVTAGTPLLADALNAREVTTLDGNAGADGASMRTTRPALNSSAAPAGLPAWVAGYQRDAAALLQRSLPALASWAEAQVYGALQTHNLTAALGDIRLLYETMQGPRQCGGREREELTVALAKCEVAVQAAREDMQRAEQQLHASRAELRHALAQLGAAPAQDVLQAATRQPSLGARQQGLGTEEGESVGEELPLSARRDGQLLQLKQGVVAADAAVQAAKAQHKAAMTHLDGALREQRSAAGRLRLCSRGQAGAQPTGLLPGLVGEAGAALQQAYTKLWRRQIKDGLADMRRAAQLCVAALRGLAQRGTGTVADLSSLQRLVQAASDPLLAVGRVLGRLAAGSLGSTTAAALMGGLGVLRLGMGVAKAGAQLCLFLALLYYLLAAQADPLLAAARMLPLSEAGRQRTALALNRALGGVLVSSVKLIAFHFCFTWLSFRVLDLPLPYTASVASAMCALLPFVPTYAVALPATVLLLAQGRLLAPLLFFAVHFLGYFLGDTVILEDIPGGHPYMLSLGILGGIYAFDNPLQGCLLGPILLSLLSVFYRLHSEFMASNGGAAGESSSPLHRLLSQTHNTHMKQHQQQQQQSDADVHVRVQQQAGGGTRGLGSPAPAAPHYSKPAVNLPGKRVQLVTEGSGEYSPGPAPLGEEEVEAAAMRRQRSPRVPLEAPSQRASLRAGDECSISMQLSPFLPLTGGAYQADEDGGESDSVANSFSFNVATDGDKSFHD